MAEGVVQIDQKSKEDNIYPIVLSEEDLPKLLDLLSNDIDKWEEIATFLDPKMKPGSIAVVQLMQADADKKMFRIIERWLKEAHPAPTVMDLVNTLRRPFISLNRTADNIEKVYYHQPSMPPQKSVSSSAPLEKPAYCEPSYVRSESSPATLALSHKAVVQHSDNVTTQTTSEHNLDIVKSKPVRREECHSPNIADCDIDDQVAYDCCCVPKCSITDIVSRKCPSRISTSGLFPQLAAQNLSSNERDMLYGQLRMQFREISTKYAKLTSSIRASLRQQGVTAARLTENLMDLNGFHSLRCEEGDHRLLENKFSKMKEAETVDDVFVILRDYHSFFNHDIIDFIVEQVGTEEDKGNLEKYKEDFTEYCQRSIFECPPLMPNPSVSEAGSSPFVELVMKVDSILEPYTAEAVRLFKFKVAKLLQITKYALQLCSAKEGCLQLTFQIPRFMKTVMFPLDAKQRKGLTELGIIKLECDGVSQPLTEEDSVALTSEATVRSKPVQSSSNEAQIKKVNECISFKLLGECQLGSRCSYFHGEKHPNPVEEYVSFPADQPPDFQPPIGRRGHSSSKKSYIVVESDRDPTKEVKIIAEDEDTYEYARRIIFSQRGRRSMRPHIPKEEQACIRLKLLGNCDDDQCQYKHEGVTPVDSRKKDYVPSPTGNTASLRKCIGRFGFTEKNECYLTLQSDRHPDTEVLVYAENEDTLEYAKTQLTIQMGRAYTTQYLAFCYIHPEGVAEPNLTMKFQRRHEHKEDYTIIKADAVLFEEASSVYSADTFNHLNPERLPSSISSLLDTPDKAIDHNRKNNQHMRVLKEYKEDIHKKLREGLQWMFDKNLKPKLEGRLGKLRFYKPLPDIRDSEGFDVNRLINFLFKNEHYKRFFYPEVVEQTRSALERDLLTETGSTTITYDMKMGVKGKGKLDVRLQFTDAEPKIVQVKKNESKVLILDVMCLNREHDIRVSLNTIDIGSPDDSTVQNFLATVTMPSEGVVSFVPLGPEEEWTVRMLRHKIRKAYFINHPDSQGSRKPSYEYMVTISKVHEYEIKKGDLKSCDMIEVKPEDSRVHTEIELHNLNWEIAVGHQLGLTTEESLILLIEPDKIPDELRSKAQWSTWSPDMIMKDFEGDDFFQMMYNLNQQ